MNELSELMMGGVDGSVKDFIYCYFDRFTERGMSEEAAATTIVELCDEFFGFWRFYQEKDAED